MPDDVALLSAFREELIATGLIRRPGDAGAAHPAHIERQGGTPAPGEGEGAEVDDLLVIGLRASGELAEGTGYEAAQRRRLVIDVLYRVGSSAGVREAMAVDAAIRARLFRPETNYGYGFVLGGPASPAFVHQAALWGGLSLIGGGSEDRLAKYLLEAAP